MLKKLTVDQFDQIHHIMEQSFPRDERRPREEQLALFEKENYHVFGMTDQNGCVIALIAVWDLQTVVFVEHFAVSPDHRNGGLGSRLLQDLIHTLEVPLCLEVELPESGFMSGTDSFITIIPICNRRFPKVRHACLCAS